MSEIRNWHYIDGPRRVGPFDNLEWAELVRDGIVRPETKVWNEALPEWAPYASIAARFPLPEVPEREKEEESEGELQPIDTFRRRADAPTTTAEEDTPTFDPTVLQRDYKISGRESIRRSWRVYRENSLLFGGATMLTWFLLFLGSSLPAGLALIMPLALNGVFIGGLYSVFIKRLRGQHATTIDLFSGFRRGIFRNLAMRTLIGTLIAYSGLLAGGVALTLMGLTVENTNDPVAIMESIQSFFAGLDGVTLLTVMLILLVCMLPSIFLGIFWIFATPLIRDYALPWGTALRASWTKVQQHPLAITRAVFYCGIVSAFPAVAVTFVVALFAAEAATVVMGVVFVLLSLPLFLGSLTSLYEAVFDPHSPTEPEPAQEEAEAGR